MDEQNPLYERGYEMLRRVQGEDAVNRLQALFSDVDGPYEDIAVASYATVWARTGALSLKHRTLATVAMLSVLGDDDEFRTHLQGALRNGWTQGELLEVLTHTLLYAGAPRGMHALRVALEIFKNPPKHGAPWRDQA